MHFARFPALFVLAVILVPAAAALDTLGYGNHEFILVLRPGEDAAYIINMSPGDRLMVDLAVTDGGNVDFYLTNVTAYNAYKSGHIDYLYYLTEQSCRNCSVFQYTYDSLATNEYVLLIDNTANTEGGALPTGPVTVTGKVTVERNIWTFRNIAITAAAVTGIIVFMAYLRWPGRKA